MNYPQSENRIPVHFITISYISGQGIAVLNYIRIKVCAVIIVILKLAEPEGKIGIYRSFFIGGIFSVKMETDSVNQPVIFESKKIRQVAARIEYRYIKVPGKLKY